MGQGRAKTATPNPGGLKEQMRSSKSRSRSKSNRNRSVGNVVNRVFDSSGPEGKVRGTPQQIIDKYSQLARDAQLSNDGVAAENFQQHAEHYTRMLSEAMREAEARREQHEAQQQAQRERNSQRNTRDEGKNNTANAAPNTVPDTVPDTAPAPVAEDAPQPDVDMSGGADVIDLAEGGDNGLVETPESKPKRPSRSKKPRPDSTPEASDTPETAQ